MFLQKRIDQVASIMTEVSDVRNQLQGLDDIC